MKALAILALATLTTVFITSAYAQELDPGFQAKDCNEWTVTYPNGTIVEHLVCNWMKVTTPLPPALNDDIFENMTTTEDLKKENDEKNEKKITIDDRPDEYDDYSPFEKLVYNEQKKACAAVERGSEKPKHHEICKRADVEKLWECTRGIKESAPVQTFGTFLMAKELRDPTYTPDYHSIPIIRMFDMALEECIAQRIVLEPEVLGRQYLNLSQEPEYNPYHADLASTNKTYPSTPDFTETDLYFEGQIALKKVCEDDFYTNAYKQQIGCPDREFKESCYEPTEEVTAWITELTEVRANDPYFDDPDYVQLMWDEYNACMERNAMPTAEPEPQEMLPYYQSMTPMQRFFAYQDNPNDPNHIVKGQAGDWKRLAGLQR